METIAEIGIAAGSVYEAARNAPEVFFPLLIVGLIVIWIKWWTVRKGSKAARKDNFAGWIKDGEEQNRDLQTVLVMKPVKLKRLSLASLAFFGGGAVFLWLTILQRPDATLKEWVVFGIMLGFSILALGLLWFSFTRIMVFSDRVERTALFRKRFVGLFSEVESTAPISKTIAGGVYVTFRNGKRLRVIPRMSGYHQFLERLARNDAKLRLMLSLFTKQARENL
ncbi:hypothetical protein [uncultured Sulfitobacter sp.]|uniref:hypothetical protein n=1 Tax=uncultured Sulfitobacter sp. TaxID=191468 RepID=UPI00263412DB|nr:hypothetical protein [uncultured Sulfitobacter sp.]